MSENTTPREDISNEVEAILAEPKGYDGFVRTLFNRSGDPSKDFAHAVLGLATEVDELMAATEAVNAVEELGDLAFYMQALSQVITDHAGVPEVNEDLVESLIKEHQLENRTAPDQLAHLRTELLDQAKRWIGYGRAPADLAKSLVMGALMCNAATRMCVAHSTPEGVVVRANVAKLLQRYQGVVFSADHAVNRDTDAERKVLEDHVGAR